MLFLQENLIKTLYSSTSRYKCEGVKKLFHRALIAERKPVGRRVRRISMNSFGNAPQIGLALGTAATSEGPQAVLFACMQAAEFRATGEF